jgi:hypothetical protein
VTDNTPNRPPPHRPSPRMTRPRDHQHFHPGRPQRNQDRVGHLRRLPQTLPGRSPRLERPRQRRRQTLHPRLRPTEIRRARGWQRLHAPSVARVPRRRRRADPGARRRTRGWFSRSATGWAGWSRHPRRGGCDPARRGITSTLIAPDELPCLRLPELLAQAVSWEREMTRSGAMSCVRLGRASSK